MLMRCCTVTAADPSQRHERFPLLRSLLLLYMFSRSLYMLGLTLSPCIVLSPSCAYVVYTRFLYFGPAFCPFDMCSALCALVPCAICSVWCILFTERLQLTRIQLL